ncbi:carbohydrate ABC transporter permease [Acuticoccus mangrovi]|uniref:Sugar ABC transporter permease n=1 Tax=Acuticoccus mangrovi TaxID=2796142 RepID=A0A934MFT2_9HYPH|nr:sugar ABC transporter permease [Acuticoccus mangrovi]MBJ3774221.1 sugar ABC transporter permease [Acuticoccus mangrovi]
MAIPRDMNAPATALTDVPPARDHANPRSAIAAFLTPALLIYAAFTALPVARTFFNSVHLVVPNRPDEWVGFTHYAELWTDKIFWKAVHNTLTWAVAAPILEVTIATLLALCLYAKVPFARFLRVAWFTPVLMSYVVVGILWMWILNYDWGALNEILRGIGLGGLAQPWLGHPATALPSLIGVTTWMWTGFNMVVILAAMSSLPSEVLEAAELDNCGWFAKLWFVILPLIRPTLLNLVILSFIGKMKIFDLVWVTTRGNPLWSTETVSTYVYKRAFQWSEFDLGYPSTIAVVWFVIVLAGVLLLTAIFRQRDRIEY